MVDEEHAQFQYDVCLSFAGEQRTYVEAVAKALAGRGVRVFYDDYEKAALWGKDLYAHLDEVYQHLGRYCVLFASDAYAKKVWTSHERRSAQARALMAKQDYLLPARFDDTPIPGLPNTIHYIDLRVTSPEELVALILAKLGHEKRRNYFPPVPDRLFELLEVDDDAEAREHAHSQAWSFFQALRRMNEEERHAILAAFRFGCPADLPENIHVNVDLLRRVTGMPVAKLKRLLGGLRSLGFTCSMRDETEEESTQHGNPLGRSEMFVIDWVDLSDTSDYPALLVAYEMVGAATEGYCENHGREFLERLDFSQLSSATATEESHS